MKNILIGTYQSKKKSLYRILRILSTKYTKETLPTLHTSSDHVGVDIYWTIILVTHRMKHHIHFIIHYHRYYLIYNQDNEKTLSWSIFIISHIPRSVNHLICVVISVKIIYLLLCYENTEIIISVMMSFEGAKTNLWKISFYWVS